jgi:hypothetical protein
MRARLGARLNQQETRTILSRTKLWRSANVCTVLEIAPLSRTRNRKLI